MRVLQVISTLGTGGAELQLASLTQGLQALGCEVHVAVLARGPNLRRIEESGATVHVVPARGNLDPLIGPRLISLVRRIRPAVVQTWLPQMDVFGGAAALATRTPWILSERHSGRHYKRNARERLRRTLGRFADVVVANSHGGLVGWKRRTAVIPNAVRFEEIDRTSPDTSDYGSAKVVLFVGRLVEVKNLPTFVHAVREVLEQRDIVALVVGGGGPITNEVQTLAAAAKDRIRFLGHSDNVASFMKRADVIVVPSWHEGKPNVVLEAAAARCPLVVSDIPAHREWLDEESALFARPDDASGFAAAILESLDDPASARARAARAREIVSPWSVERAARAYLDLYLELQRR